VELQDALSLRDQGVEHGAVITISVRADDLPVRLHDDVSEAMAYVVACDVQAWKPEYARPLGVCAAAALLLAGTPLLLTGAGSGLVTGAAFVLAGALLVGAVVLSRASADTPGAVTAANLGCLYAAIGGFSGGSHTSLPGAPVELAGASVVVAGVIAAVVMTTGRFLVTPAVVVGLTLGASGALLHHSLDPAPFLTTLLAVVVVTSSAFPGMALDAAGAGRHLGSTADPVADGLPGVDLARLSRDAAAAREILVASSATAGTLIVLLVPVAASFGPLGCTVAILASAVAMLRTRRYHAALDVLIGAASGALGLAAVLLTLVWQQGPWRLWLAIAGATAGVVVLALTRRPSDSAVRRGRVGDLVESAALAALLPAVVLASTLAIDRP
jgi:hypothetical protein